jgi:pimeloyl-ACP methyl ester carboxylesterase
MYFSMLCSEWFNPADQGAYDRQTATVPPVLRDAMRRPWDELIASCAQWPLPPRGTISNDPVSADLPVMVASGENDPVTPPEYGRLVASTLSRSVSVVYTNAGHGATFSSPCGRSHVVSFLADSGRPLDPACAASLALRFIIPDAVGGTFLASNRQLTAQDFPYSQFLHEAIAEAMRSH